MRPHRWIGLTIAIEEKLDKLKASQSSSMSHKLGGLKDLYQCVDGLLQLPLNRQSISNERPSECVEEVLNVSLRMLDVCSTTRDVLSETEECIKGLELCVRRRRGRESGLKSDVDEYLASRKNLNGVVCKCLKNLKTKDKNHTTPLDSISNLVTMIRILRGVEEIRVSVFESILSSISQSKAKTKASGWSVVSKIMQSKRLSSEADHVDANEVEKIEEELLVLKSSKYINFVQVQNVLKGLEALESSIQELEEELGCVYRQLLKTRVFSTLSTTNDLTSINFQTLYI